MNEDHQPCSWIPPDSIVFSGGGPDGISFVGSIRRLEEGDGLRRIKTIVGSSAGAIIGLLLTLGLSSREMEGFVRERYEDGSFRDLDVEGLVEFVARMGVDDGSRMVSALRQVLMSKIRPMSRSSDEDVTFLELAKSTGRSLMVCVTNLEDSRGELMNLDNAPDMGVLLAVRMSFGVPLVFTPVRWKGRTYVDGCLFEFCPTAHLLGPSASSILSVRISYPKSRADPVGDDGIKTMELPEYLSLLVRAAMTRSSPIAPSKANTPIVLNNVDIESLMTQRDSPCRFDITSLSLEMNDDSITRYIAHGYEATSSSLYPNI